MCHTAAHGHKSKDRTVYTGLEGQVVKFICTCADYSLPRWRRQNDDVQQTRSQPKFAYILLVSEEAARRQRFAGRFAVNRQIRIPARVTIKIYSIKKPLLRIANQLELLNASATSVTHFATDGTLSRTFATQYSMVTALVREQTAPKLLGSTQPT